MICLFLSDFSQYLIWIQLFNPFIYFYGRLVYVYNFNFGFHNGLIVIVFEKNYNYTFLLFVAMLLCCLTIPYLFLEWFYLIVFLVALIQIQIQIQIFSLIINIDILWNARTIAITYCYEIWLSWSLNIIQALMTLCCVNYHIACSAGLTIYTPYPRIKTKTEGNGWKEHGHLMADDNLAASCG